MTHNLFLAPTHLWIFCPQLRSFPPLTPSSRPGPADVFRRWQHEFRYYAILLGFPWFFLRLSDDLIPAFDSEEDSKESHLFLADLRPTECSHQIPICLMIHFLMIWSPMIAMLSNAMNSSCLNVPPIIFSQTQTSIPREISKLRGIWNLHSHDLRNFQGIQSFLY